MLRIFTAMPHQEEYMQRCLQLAAKGLGNVSPNPMVGAVLVYENRIIGEGWHQKYGGPHAEVNCINTVKEADKNLIDRSCLYVSLEPCNHFGKTPPCSHLILEHKIPKVIVGCRDPFSLVNGKGIEHLRSNGVEVVEGVVEKNCRELNKRFFTFHQKHRPYIILKWAQTADGIIGKINAPLKISGPALNVLVHKWRTEEDAILIGTNTALIDNAKLTARHWPGKQPVRVVIDRELQIPESQHLFDQESATIIFNNKISKTEGKNEWIELKNNADNLPEIISTLYKKNIQSLIVEGGSALLNSFIQAGLWDETIIITNTKMTSGIGVKAPILHSSELLCRSKIDIDEVSIYKNLHNSL